MKKWLIPCLCVAVVGFLLSEVEAQVLPKVPDAGSYTDEDSGEEIGVENKDHPVRLLIPSIGLDAPIEDVGKNEKGEMSVPDGSGDTVGWWEEGTLPGERGSAVLAAHVYAAFEGLDEVEAGADIFILTKGGETLHFIVEESKLTELDEVSPYFLFERDDTARLNLITCAGKFNRKLDTYEKRIIVYTKFVGSY